VIYAVVLAGFVLLALRFWWSKRERVAGG
jgi:hypothetical protein